MRSGQLEFFVMVGVLAVAVVVIGLAVYGGRVTPVPKEVGEAQKTVRDSFTGLVQQAARETTVTVEKFGGYLTEDFTGSLKTFPVPAAAFEGKGVPYWQACGQDASVSSAAVARNLEVGIEQYLREQVAPQLKLYGKTVTADLSRLKAKVTLLDSQVDATVTLPVKVQGYALSETYRVSVPARLGKIVKFGQDLSKELAANRPLETYTTASLYFSDTLPTAGVLTTCGQTIQLSPDKISQALENVIGYTLLSTPFWIPFPAQDDTKPKVYSLEMVNGKQYKDLAPRLLLPDNFNLPISQPIFAANSRPLARSGVLGGLFTTGGLCLAPYHYQYSFSYPVIVRVMDDLTRTPFHLASLVSVDRMEPGSCSVLVPPAFVENATACDSLLCAAGFKVLDGQGKPVPGTIAAYNDCYLGTADEDGDVSGSVACASGNLSFYTPDERFFEKQETPATINATQRLPASPNLTIHFSEVWISKASSGPAIAPGTILPFSYTKCAVLPPKGFINAVFSPAGWNSQFPVTNLQYDAGVEACQNQTPSCQACNSGDQPSCGPCLSACAPPTVQSLPVPNTDYPFSIPSGLHDVEGDTSSYFPAFNSVTGSSFKAPFTVPAQDSDVYVNLPVYTSIQGVDANDPEQLAKTMQAWCGIDAVAGSQPGPALRYSFDHQCTCADLNAVQGDLKQNGCPTLDEFTSNTALAGCDITKVLQEIKKECPIADVRGCP